MLSKNLVNRLKPISAGLLIAGLSLSLAAQAGSREQAKRLHDRLAGVPPTDAVLSTMQSSIDRGNSLDAAFTAMENSAFYNVTLKNFAAPWTNRDQTVFTPLNDYTATVIGMIRDDVPFTEKKRRLDEVERLQEKIAGEINARLQGKTLEILVEGENKGKWQGRTRSGKLSFFSDNSDCRGRLVKIRIGKTSPWSLQGRVETR